MSEHQPRVTIADLVTAAGILRKIERANGDDGGDAAAEAGAAGRVADMLDKEIRHRRDRLKANARNLWGIA